MEKVLLPSSSPIVSFRILFNSGAAMDPPGKEGVANLTAAMLAEAGTRTKSYEEIVKAMYPMATSFTAQVDKEVTVFAGQTHIDNLETYYHLVAEILTEPGWREDDFQRLRDDAINFLKINLRESNDEELGKEQLYNFIYRGTAYGHANAGTISSLEQLTLDDVKAFYARHYNQSNLVLGLSGGYPDDFAGEVQADLTRRFPKGEPAMFEAPKPEPINGLELQVIKKETRGTAISIGFPIPVTRSHPDWPALLVAQSYFGQHRSSNSFLFQQIRQIRGLNYGDYAYIEYFPNGMYLFHPRPNLARHHQIFQIWIRPVEPANGLFALRLALYHLGKYVESGISSENFESTRLFLSKFVNVLTATQDALLGYALDSHFYGIPEFTHYVREALAALTVEDVNRAIRKYLQADNAKVVVVTEDAEGFLKSVVENAPSSPAYASPMKQEVLDEDAVIGRYKLSLNPSKAAIIPVPEVFQN